MRSLGLILLLLALPAQAADPSAAAMLRQAGLIGTWAAAVWAIRFYQKHGFQLLEPREKDQLLQRYWTIPARQAETSVVLADATWRKLNPKSSAAP